MTGSSSLWALERARHTHGSVLTGAKCESGFLDALPVARPPRYSPVCVPAHWPPRSMLGYSRSCLPPYHQHEPMAAGASWKLGAMRSSECTTVDPQ